MRKLFESESCRRKKLGGVMIGRKRNGNSIKDRERDERENWINDEIKELSSFPLVMRYQE